MDLKLPITLHDELADEVIDATGILDLASGEISQYELLLRAPNDTFRTGSTPQTEAIR